MIEYCTAHRSDLSDLFAGFPGMSWRTAASLEGMDAAVPDRGEGIVAIRKREMSSRLLPQMVLVRNSGVRDFLAWTATYAAAYRPLTAYCRVVSEDQLRSLLASWRPPSLERLDDALVGLILAERILAGGADRNQMRQNSVADFEGLLAFALARAFALRGAAADDPEVAQRWSTAQRLTGSSRRGPSASDVLRVFGVLQRLIADTSLANSSPTDRVIQNVCREVWNNGHAKTAIAEVPQLRELLGRESERMAGTREERVTAVEEFVRKVGAGGDRPGELDGFAAGYLGSLIGPGGLEYAPLLAPLSVKVPSTTLWFGALCGLQKESGVAYDFGGIGRRILRDLYVEEDLLSIPRCDISIEELELLGDKPGPRFPRGSLHGLVIELHPGVLIRAGSAAREQPEEPTRHSPEDRAALAAELGRLAVRLGDVSRELAGGRAPVDPRPAPGGLFDRPPKRRRR